MGKIRQALLALWLERRYSKDEILRLYLRLAPFGGNLEGVRAASLAYFGKEPRRLSVAEAAMLVAIPQSPEWRRPDRSPEATRRARNRVLMRLLAAGAVLSDDAARAMAAPMPPAALARREFPMLAPHLADAEVAKHAGRIVHRLTLDRPAQGALEALVRDYVAVLEGRVSAAIVVVDHRTGEVVAYVGSPGLLDLERAGAIDMALAVRSPGSTLKPIIYGLAFELGLAHPDTLIEDTPARFGLYVPKNFDSVWHGTVTVRAALIHSLNIPAVKVLEAVGAGRLYSRMQQAGVDPVLPKGADPSLAMALGGVGLRLVDLAQLYAAIARGGEPVPLKHSRDGTAPRGPTAGQRLLSEIAAWYVRDILCRALPPANAKAGQVCYKTGTSYGFRDAWSVGFDGRYAIAVWVGRPDGAAVAGLTGRTSAAPLLFDAFARLSLKRAPLPPPPPGVIRATTGELPPPLKRFREGAVEDARGDRSARAGAQDRLPARPRRDRGGGGRGRRGGGEGRGRRPAAHLAARRRSHRLRPRQPRGRAARRPPRLLPPLRHRRQGPHGPGDDPGEVGSRQWADLGGLHGHTGTTRCTAYCLLPIAFFDTGGVGSQASPGSSTKVCSSEHHLPFTSGSGAGSLSCSM